MAYEDTKHRKDKRVPVYLSEYGYEKLERIVDALGGQKSAVGRDAMERGLDQMLHELESANSSKSLRVPSKSHVHA